MLKPALIPFALGLACGTAGAQTCEAIQSQIELKIKATGTAGFRLTTVPAESTEAGKPVGTCDRGAKKILYSRTQPVAAASSTPAVVASPTPKPSRAKSAGTDVMITECKDGSMSLGGDCKK